MNRRRRVNQFGWVMEPEVDTTGMLVPIRCRHCGRVYDLCKGEPIQRYADCTVYRTPCCQRVVDDREWVSAPAFTRIERG